MRAKKDIQDDSYRNKLQQQVQAFIESQLTPTINKFEVEIDKNMNTIRDELSRPNRFVSIELLHSIDDLCKSKGIKYDSFISLWKKSYLEQKTRLPLAPFFHLKEDELLWIANNIEFLREITDYELGYVDHISLLNENGQKELGDILTNLNATSIIEFRADKYEQVQFNEPEKYEYKTELECFYKLFDPFGDKEDREHSESGKQKKTSKPVEHIFPKNYSFEDKVNTIDSWIILKNLDAKALKLFEMFRCYHTGKKVKISTDQIAVATATIVLEREPKYLK